MFAPTADVTPELDGDGVTYAGAQRQPPPEAHPNTICGSDVPIYGSDTDSIFCRFEPRRGRFIESRYEHCVAIGFRMRRFQRIRPPSTRTAFRSPLPVLCRLGSQAQRRALGFFIEFLGLLAGRDPHHLAWLGRSMPSRAAKITGDTLVG
jgi:hypothetical protein